MGRTGWTVGRVAGVPVVIGPGWFVMAGLLVFLALPFARRLVGDEGSPVVWAVAGVLLLLASVFLHELAHALVGRRLGFEVSSITVTFLGGHTLLGSAAAGPGATALVAAVGPVANLVIAALAWGGARLAAPSAVAGLLGVTALVNAALAAFNLIPGLPLDGGRVLEALVWRLGGRRATGTAVAARAGQVLAVGVLAWVLVPDLLAGRRPDLVLVVWGAIIGSTLWSGAVAALRQARVRQRVEELDLAAMTRPAVPAPLTAAVADLAPGAVTVLVGPAGEPVAVVDPAAVARVPAALRATTPVTAVARAVPPTAVVPAGLRGQQALAAARAAGAAPELVVVHDGRPTGVVPLAAVAAALRGARDRA